VAKAKKHHFVPQGYLRFFAELTQSESRWKIGVYDKELKRHFYADVSDVAQKKYFNSVDCEATPLAPKRDPLYYEETLAKTIEGKIPSYINNFLACCTLSTPKNEVLSEEIKQSIAYVMVVQLLRTQKARKYLLDRGREPFEESIEIGREMVDALKSSDKDRYYKVLDQFQYSEEVMKDVILDTITDYSKVMQFASELVNNRIWIVYENGQYRSNPFVTSDEPVLMYNTLNRSVDYGDNAINVPATVIAFPISPQFMIATYHKRHYFAKCLKLFCNKRIKCSADFVHAANMAQLFHSERQVYTKPSSINILSSLSKEGQRSIALERRRDDG